MEKIKNLNTVSQFLFFLMAFLYIALVLAFRNGFMADLNVVLMRVLDLPFAFIALVYGGSTLALQFSFDKGGNLKSFGWSVGIFVVCLGLFTTVAIINFAFPAVM